MRNDTANDIRLALRWLRRSPAFTFAAVATLGIGIGFNTALFSIVDSVLLRPLPVKSLDRLADVFMSANDGDRYATSSYPDFLDLRSENTAFEEMLGFSPMIAALNLTDRTRLLMGEIVTGNYFQMLGVRAAMGRTLLPEDDRPGAEPVVMVSDRYWHRDLGADPKVIGRTICLRGRPYTIVGVAPRKPRKGASKQDWAAYARACRAYRKAMKDHRKRQQEEGLSAQGARLLNDLRQRCDAIAALTDRILWAVVDASFCNRTVFRLLDPFIVLIGRVRKDICLYEPADPNQVGRGRKARYGRLLPTPEGLREDAATAWEKCSVFAAGKRHELQYKTVAPVLWRSGAGPHPMRLIVIRPLRYRAHGHTLYRQPAYLLVNDTKVPVAEALQAYIYRWEIEVDQKEGKDLLGVGQAQVWSDISVVRQPAFHVATYAALLVAAVKAYGLNNPSAAGRLPLWRERKPPMRLSAAHLIANLRTEIQEYEAIQSRTRRKKKGDEFLAAAMRGRFGEKFPITAKAIMENAWT